MFSNYIKLLRLDHFSKTIFIIPGIVYALYSHNNLDFNFLTAFAGIILLQISASANYLINEYLDRNNDRYHPLKSKRVAVSIKLNVKIICTIYFFLLTIILFSIKFLNILNYLILLLMLLNGILYNVKPFRIKNFFLVDILSESVNNPLRFLYGYYLLFNDMTLGLLIEELPSVLVLIFFLISGIFLMAAKRLSEYNSFIKNNDLDILIKYRPSYKFYNFKRLNNITLGSLILMGFLLGIFTVQYSLLTIFFLVPFIFFTVIYYNYIFENQITQKPELLFYDKKILILLIIFTIISIMILTDFMNLNYVEEFFTFIS